MSSTSRAEVRRAAEATRLISAATRLAAQHGYPGITLGQLTAEAGISRSAFYAHFSSREDCLLAAIDGIEAGLLAQVRRAIRASPPQLAARSATTALISFATREPESASVLMRETLAGAPRLLDARDRVVAEIARRIERAYESLPHSTAVPHVSAEAIIGAVMRLLALRLGDEHQDTGELAPEIAAWLEGYSEPLGEHRWHQSRPSAAPARTAPMNGMPRRAPMPLPLGRPKISARAVAENHRQRILFAMAEAVGRRGYLATSVTEIIQLAEIEGRAFYRLFDGKQAALLGLHEEAFHEAMAATAGGFFGGASWPERVWAAGWALSAHLEQNPLLARASLIERHAGGPAARGRAEALVEAFTLFLHEGHELRPGSEPPSPVALRAISAAAFELIYLEARRGPEMRIAGLLGNLVHVALAPFLGSARASELIEGLIEEERTGGEIPPASWEGRSRLTRYERSAERPTAGGARNRGAQH